MPATRPTKIKGREAFLKWAEECCYEIDWKNGVLIYHDPRSAA